jgi:hypothetical protein
MELWGIYDDYEVSSLGRIRYQSKITEQLLTREGYSYILINDQREFVHRLIAKVFIPNPENKPQVDHINHNRNDNRLENLRWATCKENCNNKGSFKKNKNIWRSYDGWEVKFYGTWAYREQFSSLEDAIARRDQILKLKAEYFASNKLSDIQGGVPKNTAHEFFS